MTDRNRRGNQSTSDQKQKGILKKDKNEMSDPNIKRRSIKWDEMNVTATLHPVGKDYGLMKIDEAPTPYYSKGSNVPQKVDPAELTRRLEELKVQNNKSPACSSSRCADAGSISQEEKRKRELFLKKRREHYNEFKMAKQALGEINDSDKEEN